MACKLITWAATGLRHKRELRRKLRIADADHGTAGEFETWCQAKSTPSTEKPQRTQRLLQNGVEFRWLTKSVRPKSQFSNSKIDRTMVLSPTSEIKNCGNSTTGTSLKTGEKRKQRIRKLASKAVNSMAAASALLDDFFRLSIMPIQSPVILSSKVAGILVKIIPAIRLLSRRKAVWQFLASLAFPSVEKSCLHCILQIRHE